jgi:hypothetical protein
MVLAEHLVKGGRHLEAELLNRLMKYNRCQKYFHYGQNAIRIDVMSLPHWHP